MPNISDLLTTNTANIAANTTAVASAGGTATFLAKVEVTVRNASSLTIGSSYITAAHNDYFFEFIVPNNGWASNDEYRQASMQLQHNGGSYTGPNHGRLYNFRNSDDVGHDGNGTFFMGEFRSYSSGTSSTQVITNHSYGRILNTQDLNSGARVHSSYVVYHQSGDYSNGLHNADWYADGTASYKITGMKVISSSGDFPVGTRLFLYGINRS